MSMVGELNRVMGAVLIGNRRSVDRQDLEYAVRVAGEFFRHHGQALIESLVLLDQLACCIGQDCGCQAVTKREVAEHLKEASSVVTDASRYRILRSHADERDNYQVGPGGTMLVGYAEDEDIFSSGEELDRACDAALAKAREAMAMTEVQP